MKDELIDCFKAECAKRKLDPEDYMELFCERVEEKKTISVKEDAVALVVGLKSKEEKKSKPQKSQATRMFKFAQSNAYLFRDQYGEEHARIFLPWITNSTNATNAKTYTRYLCSKEESSVKKEGIGNSVSDVSSVKTRQVILPLRSRQFRDWLSNGLRKKEGTVPSSTAVYSATDTLCGQMLDENKQHKLYNRVAPDPDGNGIWIDMADENWRAIHVTAEGWDIVDNPPILFRRFKHEEPLAVPIRVSEGEEVKIALKFLEFVNIPEDRTDQIMFMISIISYFVPNIEHPCLCVAGSAGSAKSMLFTLSKRLVDPSKHETLIMSDSENGLAQQLYHSYFACYDNLKSLKDWKSNLLCQAITGGGLSKRKLYSDDEDIIYQFYRCVGLNGINVSARNGDLLDRIILFIFKAIPENERIPKTELLAKFEKERPRILGAMMTVLSKAIKFERQIKLDGFKRLADFHKWGCAIAQALGYTVEDFNDAYSVKVELQTKKHWMQVRRLRRCWNTV